MTNFLLSILIGLLGADIYLGFGERTFMKKSLNEIIKQHNTMLSIWEKIMILANTQEQSEVTKK